MRWPSALLALLVAGCVTPPEIPPDIRKDTAVLAAGRDRVSVDFYRGSGRGARPLAVVSHGFLADKERMAHWGLVLARAGFLVAVPTHPALVDPRRNAQAHAAVVRAGRAGRWPVGAPTDGRVLLVGFSKGGLETILAAAELGDSIDAWVGLDPVDRYRQGRAEAGRVRVPGLALLARPAALNNQGNARDMLSTYAGPLRLIAVEGAGHLDAESPRGRGEFANFRREVLDFVHSVFGTPVGGAGKETTMAPRRSPSAKPVASSSG